METLGEAITSSLPAQESRLDSFVTAHYPTLSQVISYCKSGWTALEQLEDHVLLYWLVKDNFTLAGNLLLYNRRVVIPPALQRSSLEKIHGPHQGQQKSRLRAKCSLSMVASHWAAVEQLHQVLFKMCRAIHICQRSHTPTPLPSHRWKRVGSDLFKLQGKHFLCLVDYFSRYV